MELHRKSTDLPGLEALALQQSGYFRREDAHRHGLSDRLLSYHTRTGRFERVLPAVFRLTNAPISQNDDLHLAWVWSRYRGAISHESALALYGLSDLMPTRVHLTVPPDERRRTGLFVLHRARLSAYDTAPYEGIRATRPARAIVEAAADGADPQQVQRAIHQALARAILTREQLRAAAERPRYRNRSAVHRLIEEALRHAATATGR